MSIEPGVNSPARAHFHTKKLHRISFEKRRNSMSFAMRRITFLLVAGVVAAPGLATAADVSPATAANMARNCFGCHGPDGRSPGAIPALNGKSADFIVQSFKDFRSGERPSTVMGRHAKGYTDAEVTALAEYISGLK
jgi:sulfide dehydrogenase cytochrome subunit